MIMINLEIISLQLIELFSVFLVMLFNIYFFFSLHEYLFLFYLFGCFLASFSGTSGLLFLILIFFN